MVADSDACGNDRGDDQRRDPSAFEEFLGEQHEQNARANDETGSRQRQSSEPIASGAVPGPVQAQPEERNSEGQEHADAVKDHERRDATSGPQKDEERCDPHDENPVLGDQARREVAELVRHPRVGGHVGEHRRTSQKAGVGGNEEQSRFKREHHKQRSLARPGIPPEAVDDRADGNRIERLPFHRAGVPQQIEQDDPAGGEGERQRHIEHGDLAGMHARLGEHVDVVRHCFDPRIGAASLGIREQEQRGDPCPAELGRKRRGFAPSIRCQSRKHGRVREHAVDDQEGVGEDETEKDRQQHGDRLLHPAQVEQHERGDERDLGGELVGLEAERKQREERIDAARDRDRNREYVVENQRGARSQARVRADQARGDPIAASARGKKLDHLVVGERDDEHRHRGGEREVQAELGVLAQGPKRLFGAVAGRRDSVRAEAHPGEKGDQRDVPSRLLVQGIERLAEQLLAQIRKHAHERPPLVPRDARPFSRRRANTVISLAACLSPFFPATSIPLR